MPAPQCDVSVVVPTRRRPELLRRCLVALLEQETDRAYEIVVVNDDVDPIEVPADPRLRVVTTGGRGVATARNVGVTVARADLLAFTDDDTVPAPDWVQSVADAAAAAPDTLAFAGVVRVRGLDPLHAHAPRPSPVVLCGANVAYRRAAFEAVGGFDERFTGWMPEDIDLGMRVRALGPVQRVPGMVVDHPPRPMRFGELVAQARTVEGTWLLFRKHPSLSQWRLPLRWGPVVGRTRYWLGMLSDPAVVRRSPARAARIVALATCSGAVAAWNAWRRWPGPG